MRSTVGGAGAVFVLIMRFSLQGSSGVGALVSLARMARQRTGGAAAFLSLAWALKWRDKPGVLMLRSRLGFISDSARAPITPMTAALAEDPKGRRRPSHTDRLTRGFRLTTL